MVNHTGNEPIPPFPPFRFNSAAQAECSMRIRDCISARTTGDTVLNTALPVDVADELIA